MCYGEGFVWLEEWTCGIGGTSILTSSDSSYNFLIVIHTLDETEVPHCHIYSLDFKRDIAWVKLPKGLGEEIEVMHGGLSDKRKKAIKEWFSLPSWLCSEKTNLERSWEEWKSEVGGDRDFYGGIGEVNRLLKAIKEDDKKVLREFSGLKKKL